MEEFAAESIAAWTDDFKQGPMPSLESWFQIVTHPEAWTDLAFIKLCADAFQVSCSTFV